MQTIDKFFYDVICEQARNNPDGEAVVMGDTRITYRQFLEKVDAVASALLNKGLKKGDKVALWSTACPAWLYTFCGIIRAGGVALVLNANLTFKDAKPLIEFADTKYMTFGKMHDAAGHSDDIPKIAEAFGLEPDNCISYLDEDFSNIPENKPDTKDFTVRDDAYIIYTSGTTSFPKAVLTSQFAMINLADQLSKVISSVMGKKAVLGVPLFHAYGLTAVWAYFCTGGTLIIPEVVKADVIADTVEREEATDLYSVAAIYQGIVDKEELTAKTASRVRICALAGSYVSPVQMMRFETNLNNAVFLNMYGMTECAAVFTTPRPEDDVSVRYNSVGRAIDGVELATWDEQKGILPAGEVGEIITRGFHLKNGYYKLPPEKQAIDEDGWLHTGDLGVLDENGNLRIAGRIKDLIIKGGENLTPGEIENEVMSHPSIGMCRIFGYKDRIYGENLGACVTLAPGAEFKEDEVRKYMKEKVGSYKSPVYYFVFDAFPLNANGKVDQRSLHIEMLKRLHRLTLENKLEKGIQIINMSLKNSTYNISPVAALLKECAVNLGFGSEKAETVNYAVRESLMACVNETSSEIGDIGVTLLFMQTKLRVTFAVTEIEDSPQRKLNYQKASAKVLKIVDDWDYRALDSNHYLMSIDFTYDKDFDIKDFLMKHEPIE